MGGYRKKRLDCQTAWKHKLTTYTTSHGTARTNYDAKSWIRKRFRYSAYQTSVQPWNHSITLVHESNPPPRGNIRTERRVIETTWKTISNHCRNRLARRKSLPSLWIEKYGNKRATQDTRAAQDHTRQKWVKIHGAHRLKDFEHSQTASHVKNWYKTKNLTNKVRNICIPEWLGGSSVVRYQMGKWTTRNGPMGPSTPTIWLHMLCAITVNQNATKEQSWNNETNE